MPNITIGDTNRRISTLIDWSEIPRTNHFSISSIATFDLHGTGADPVDVEVITGTAYAVGSVYVSQSAMYIQTNASIHKFEFEADGAGVDFAAKGDLPHHDARWFSQAVSLHEHEGRLQLATHGTGGDDTVDIHVMQQDGESLEIVGSLLDIAPGEQIYSTHFEGSRAFVVTYEKVDPFFVIDLSDPTTPSITGELKVPGYSNYLHPISEDLVIGIGRNADPDTGLFQELQVSLFGISDPSNPTLIDRYAFAGGRSTWSALTETPWGQADGNGVTFDSDNGILALPIHSRSGWAWFDGDEVDQLFTGDQSAVSLFQIDGAGIAAVGQVDFDDKARRTVIVGDHLVYMSNERLKVAERTAPVQTIASIDLPKTTREIEEVTFDMNNDGVATPLDALLMINEVNSIGFGNMGTVSAAMHDAGKDEMALKIDVNNDGDFSPLDPLMVINALTTTSSEAALSAGVVVSDAAADVLQTAEAEEHNAAQEFNESDAVVVRSVPPTIVAQLDSAFAQADEDDTPDWRGMSFLDRT